MIIYFYLFIPLVCRLAEASSIKGRTQKNELVPFLSSSLDPQKKDNSLKIVSNEPFIIQFQMPQQGSESIDREVKLKDKKEKRQNKKRMSKTKPMRKKIRKRRDLSETEPVEEKPREIKKPLTGEKIQESRNKTQHSVSRLDILKALHSHAMKQETKKHRSERMKSLREKTDASNRNLHPNHLTSSDTHPKSTYPNTPKTEHNNYSYKDLIADRERLEEKISYIKNLLHINDTSVIGGRVRRRSDSDKNANKLAKMFLTLSSANGSREKRKPRCRDHEQRTMSYYDGGRRGRPTRVSNNEERFKVKKWIEFLKKKRSGKTCTCMEDEYNEENDVFPLELKLSKGSQYGEADTSGEESFDNQRDSFERPGKTGSNRNSHREDVRSKLRALANGGKRKYELPLDDLEVYRSRAKQILQNAEEILDKIKEEEERRLAAPSALVSQLKEITSRIQGDPRNNENDLIRIIQKNLGWNPQAKSQSGTSDTEGNTFVENMKSLVFDPYEKAKELTDENTKKITSYLLRNLGKIGFSEDDEEIGKSDESSQVYHGQVPQTEEMLSANLAKENPESESDSDSYSKTSRGREEVQNWSDTLSAMLGGNNDNLRTENTPEEMAKKLKAQEDLVKKRTEEIIQEQEKKVNEYPKTSEKYGSTENDEITKIDLMEEAPESPKFSNSQDEMLELQKSDENEGKSISAAENMPEETVAKELEKVKSTDETESDVVASENQRLVEEKDGKFDESAREDTDETEDDKIRAELPLGLEEVKAAAGENTPKEDEAIAEYIENAEDKDLESPKADENQEEESKDVTMAAAGGSEKETGNEKTDQVLKSPQETQADTAEKGGREDNDVINSRHLVEEEPGRRKAEELEELTEDIKKVEDESLRESSEETLRQEQSEDDITKEDSSETDLKNEEREGSSDSVALEKQTETDLDEDQSEITSEDKDSSTGVVQASQESKELTEYDNSKKDASSEKETSDDGFVESETVENKGERMEESEKFDEESRESGERIAETSDVLKSEKETIDDSVAEKEASARRETEGGDDTSKDVLEDSRSEEVEENETVKEKSNAGDDSLEKDTLKEKVDEIEAEGDDQEELSAKASIDDADNEQKSGEKQEEENMDENVESSWSENPEKEMEKTSEEVSLKGNQKSEEDEVDKEEVSAKESNAEVQETESDNEESKEEPVAKAEETEDEIEDVEESPLKSENLEDTEKSDESLTNENKSEETVKAAEDETMEEEKVQENYDKTEKVVSDEGDEKTEDTKSAEDENVEKAMENESAEETAKEDDENEKEESGEANKSPKIVMSIKEGLEEEETMKSNAEEGDEANASVGDTLNAVDDGDDQGSANEDSSLREANPEAGEELDTQETDDTEELNVRADKVKDYDNYVDGMLRSEDDESEEVEEAPVKERNNDGVEGTDKVKQDKQDETVQFAAVSEDPEERVNLLKSSVKVPKSIGNIMSYLDGNEKDFSLTNLNPEKIDDFIGKIDEEEQKIKTESEDADCRKECACADQVGTRSRNSGRYEIVKDFLYWMRDLHLNRALYNE